SGGGKGREEGFNEIGSRNGHICKGARGKRPWQGLLKKIKNWYETLGQRGGPAPKAYAIPRSGRPIGPSLDLQLQ
ncbi:hypothetical protein PanWU01x14_112010, partial [Parasponia andersonii]